MFTLKDLLANRIKPGSEPYDVVELARLCEGWHNGPKSMMYRFWRMALRRETMTDAKQLRRLQQEAATLVADFMRDRRDGIESESAARDLPALKALVEYAVWAQDVLRLDAAAREIAASAAKIGVQEPYVTEFLRQAFSDQAKGGSSDRRLAGQRASRAADRADA
jgi:hypothetical protein